MKILWEFRARTTSLTCRFIRETSGQFAILFAFSMLPILGFIGIAVDYARAQAALVSLNAALDSAAISAAARARNSGSVDNTNVVKGYFLGAAGNTYTTITNFNMTSAGGYLTQTINLNYTATLPTTFMQIFGFKTMNLSGQTATQVNVYPYVDYYLLLDNSPSMGLAGTPDDITKMKSVTAGYVEGACEFACHVADSTSKENDYLAAARANNVMLRIDFLTQAVQNLIDTAVKTAALPNEFRMGIYTFNSNFNTIGDVTSDLAGQKAKAANITMVDSIITGDAQTSFEVAFPMINAVMTDGGTGQTSQDPQKFLFFVTDGVGNSYYGGSSGTNDVPLKCFVNAPYQYGAGKAPLNLNYSCDMTSKPGAINAKLDGTYTQRVIGNLSSVWGDNDWCTTLKARNITIAVLYIDYLPLPDNDTYATYVAKLDVETPLKNCASPGYYFKVENGSDINTAIQAMFLTSVSSLNLTK